VGSFHLSFFSQDLRLVSVRKPYIKLLSNSGQLSTTERYQQSFALPVQAFANQATARHIEAIYSCIKSLFDHQQAWHLTTGFRCKPPVLEQTGPVIQATGPLI